MDMDDFYFPRWREIRKGGKKKKKGNKKARIT
jgi:hypothetical protein